MTEEMPEDIEECIAMGLHNKEIDEDRCCTFCWNQPPSPEDKDVK